MYATLMRYCWINTEVTRVSAIQRSLTPWNVVGIVLIVLGVGLFPLAIAAYVSGDYARNYVANELKAQRIFFPTDMSKEPEALRSFAGQAVDTGPEARAFATMIQGHIAQATGGRTFSEVSSAARQNSNDQSLQEARRIALEGNTIYGMLQNAYAGWLAGSIARGAALGLSLLGLLLVLIGGKLARSGQSAQSISQ